MFKKQTPGQERFAQKIERLCQEISRLEALGKKPDHLVRELELILLDYTRYRQAESKLKCI